MTSYTATYSPDDNKLRLYASSRLDKELYERVKAAGFRWAPKQDLFFSVWNPRAEDIATELAGEIEDDDKTLADRAEERAERFEGYQGKRATEAERARDAVSAIADNIPFGQPILVGHHSERRARKDAEKIENGMRKAVQLWETSEYWASRAKGALLHAKYKELPAVRARRIKTIEADLRGEQRSQAEAEKQTKLWTNPEKELTRERAMQILNSGYLSMCFPLEKYPRNPPASQYEGSMSLWSAMDAGIIQAEQAKALAVPAHERTIKRAQRWIDHYQNRLTYEKAMLDEQGASELIAPKARPKQLPLVNYEAETIATKGLYRQEIEQLPQVRMKAAEYQAIYEERRGTRVVDNSHRIRVSYVEFNADGTTKRSGFSLSAKLHAVFLTDSKTHPKPAPIERQPVTPRQVVHVPREREPEDPRAAEFRALKEAAKNGVEIVSAPELFPTSPELAERVAEEADIKPGHTVLEPSAGTGALIEAAQARGATVTAVEANYKLAGILSRRFGNATHADFLQCGEELGKFDRIIMNPPFANQADIDHVIHALKFLKDGGRLVAIMSAGVSFRSDRKAPAFREMVEKLGGVIEPLPEGSFNEAGTSVNTVLVTLDAPSKPKAEPIHYRDQTSLDL